MVAKRAALRKQSKSSSCSTSHTKSCLRNNHRQCNNGDSENCGWKGNLSKSKTLNNNDPASKSSASEEKHVRLNSKKADCSAAYSLKHQRSMSPSTVRRALSHKTLTGKQPKQPGVLEEHSNDSSISSSSTLSTRLNSKIAEATQKVIFILENGGKLEDASLELVPMVRSSSLWAGKHSSRSSQRLCRVATRAAALVLDAGEKFSNTKYISKEEKRAMKECDLTDVDSMAEKAAFVALQGPKNFDGKKKILLDLHEMNASIGTSKNYVELHEISTSTGSTTTGSQMRNDGFEFAAMKAALLVLSSGMAKAGNWNNIERILGSKSAKKEKTNDKLLRDKNTPAKRESFSRSGTSGTAKSNSSLGTLDFEAAARAATIVIACGGNMEAAFKSIEKVLGRPPKSGTEGRNYDHEQTAINAAISVLSSPDRLGASAESNVRALVSRMKESHSDGVGVVSSEAQKQLDRLFAKSENTRGGNSVSETFCLCGVGHTFYSTAAEIAVSVLSQGKSCADAVRKVEQRLLQHSTTCKKNRHTKKDERCSDYCPNLDNLDSNDLLTAGKVAVMVLASGGTRAETTALLEKLLSKSSSSSRSQTSRASSRRSVISRSSNRNEITEEDLHLTTNRARRALAQVNVSESSSSKKSGNSIDTQLGSCSHSECSDDYRTIGRTQSGIIQNTISSDGVIEMILIPEE